MPRNRIELDFGKFVLDAELFDTAVASAFLKHLPYTVRLMKWGNELYGSIGKDLGAESPVETIPPGGLAYTNNGNYVCIFFGQRPAWAVEYIGHLPDEQWKILVGKPAPESVIVRLQEKQS